MDEIRQEDGYTDWKQAIRKLNEHPLASDFNTLSIAAKVHYIVKRQGKSTPKQIRQVAKKYGWSIKGSQIKKALLFLKALSLISVGEST